MKNLKKILIIGTILFFCKTSYSQVGIGTVSPDAALDITSTTDGLLIPRVALTITTSALPLTSPITSELVYNSATVADVTPGFYYWNGSNWVRLAAGVTNDWSTTGNSGIIDGTNYIGTDASTNVDVAFRRNNAAAGKIGTTSTSFGVGALNVGASTNSSAFGTNALKLNTGANNVAVGNGALSANTTGIQNTGIGNVALAVNTGSASTAIGFETLKANTTGNNGTAVGFQALSKNTTASNNTAVGFQALTNSTIATNNTSVGFQSLLSNINGNNNTAIGHITLSGNTTGSDNTAIGHSALGRNNGNRNTSIGFESMFTLSSFSNTTAIGWHALFSNTANESTAIGYQALNNNSSGTGNTGVGFSALNNNFTGQNNTAVGNQAGFGVSSSNNTLIGYTAGQFTTGANNTVVGSNALKANGPSSNSVAIGTNALIANIAANNTAIGYNALFSNSAGIGNVAIGNQAGQLEVGSNKLYISNSATTASTSLIYGEFSPARILRTNSTFQIGDPTGSGYVFPIARGTNNQYLASNASGVLSWTSPNGTNTLSAVRTNLASDQALATTGWQLINFSNVVFDTNSEFASNRFTASNAGIYEINAGFHTDNQSNIQFYSIGVYVNGTLYQQTSGNHSNLGPVSRNINCIVNLAIGGYVEIYVENYQSTVNIDSFSGKTFFEVKQVR